MPNYNKVFLMGNLTRDPQLRYTPSQTPICEFGLAINRKMRLSSGEMKDETTFVDIVAWGKQAEAISKYVSKGRPLFVEGRLTYEQWEKDGQKRSKLRVTLETFQFVDSGRGGGQGGGGSGQHAGGAKAAPGPGYAGPSGGESGGGGEDYQYNQDMDEDTIPF